MTRGALRFTEEQYRAHAAKSDRFKVGTDQRPPDDSARPLPPGRGAPITPAPLAIARLCDEHGVGWPEPELRFHPHRKWRFDYAWVAEKIALEVEGGIWTQGRHTRGAGFLADMEKYNAAVLLGWRVLRTTPDKLADGVKSVRLLMLE